MKYYNDIKMALKKIKGEDFEIEENLITDGYLSSFEIIKVISELEKKLNIRIPLETVEIDSFNYLEDISRFICNIV